MLKKLFIPILLLTLFACQSFSQPREDFEAINDVWANFYQAFDSLDYTLMAAIHSKDLVRVAGGKRLMDYETYINGYADSFERMKTTGTTNTISLRFFERINNDAMASERGAYKLVRNNGRDDEQAYYGQFHVIFIKENDTWKILMDYDSNEENSIGEKEFLEAFAIDNLETFMKS